MHIATHIAQDTEQCVGGEKCKRNAVYSGCTASRAAWPSGETGFLGEIHKSIIAVRRAAKGERGLISAPLPQS